MKKFTFVAYDSHGNKHAGTLDALSLDAAKHRLKESGYIPVSLSEHLKDKTGLFSSLNISIFSSHSNSLELATKQMFIMLKNGIKVERALNQVKRNVRDRMVRAVLEKVHSDVRNGALLSQALAKHPSYFNNFYITMVKVGEATGTIAGAFAELSESISAQRKIAATTRQALLYPSLILIFCILSILLIFNYIVPRFEMIFKSAGHLPSYTVYFLTFSRLFVTYQPIFFTGFIFIVLGFLYLYRSRNGKKIFWKIVNWLPLVRGLILKQDTLRFVTSFAALLRNKVKLVDAFEYSVSSLKSPLLMGRLQAIKDRVVKGERLSSAFEEHNVLPGIYTGLIEAGEETGALAEIFSDIQRRLQEELDMQIVNILKMIEPILIIVMGGIVGSIIVVMMMSMLSIYDLNF